MNFPFILDKKKFPFSKFNRLFNLFTPDIQFNQTNSIILLVIFLILPFKLNAQKSVIIHSSGKQYNNLKEFNNREVQPLDKKILQSYFYDNNSITDLNRILKYDFSPNGNVSFGFYSQDWMCQWFEAPTDMIIKRAGFTLVVNEQNQNISLKLVSINISKSEIFENIGSLGRPWGHYEALGNGVLDATAFEDNPDRTGDWVPHPLSNNSPPLFGPDILSIDGNGVEVAPILVDSINQYQWVDLSQIGDYPVVPKGNLVGLAIRNSRDINLGSTMRIIANNQLGIPGFKYYATGRFSSEDPLNPEPPAWWTRRYTWNMALDVDLTGDIPPDISVVTQLVTTYDASPKNVSATIVDYNPSGGEAGIADAYLHYSFDNVNWVTAAMSNTSGDTYTAVIPEQPAGSSPDYFISAEDVGGNISNSETFSFTVGGPFGATNLLIFNGLNTALGYPQNYYFGPNYADHLPIGSYLGFDIWAYGKVPIEVLNNYENVFEFCLSGPADYNNDPTAGAGTGGNENIRDWLNADPNRNYFLSGMNWLGNWNNFADTNFVQGDFAYDILGISHSYNNVSFDGSYSSTTLSSHLFLEPNPVANQGLIQAGAENLLFDPYYEVNKDNFMDAFDVKDGAEILMTTETRGIEGIPNIQILPCAVHNVTANGNDVIFLAFDPLLINSNPDGDYGDNYIWWGYTESNYPYYVATQLFDIAVGVNNSESEVPKQFVLKQNYPNPFNPSTTIEYVIPQKIADGNNQQLFVTLSVFDILGKKIQTIVKKEQSQGTYRITFNADNLPSGIYFYRLNAGSNQQTKKMVLLR